MADLLYVDQEHGETVYRVVDAQNRSTILRPRDFLGDIPAHFPFVQESGKPNVGDSFGTPYKVNGQDWLLSVEVSEYVYCITKTVTLDQVVGVEEDADPGVKQPHGMKDLDMMRYLGYIEGRPGVEKEDGHGLFGVSGDVPISVARQMAEQHSDSTIWSHIISMDEIEAKEKGYDQLYAAIATLPDKKAKRP